VSVEMSMRIRSFKVLVAALLLLAASPDRADCG
jgi:hypothetical protein